MGPDKQTNRETLAVRTAAGEINKFKNHAIKVSFRQNILKVNLKFSSDRRTLRVKQEKCTQVELQRRES